MSGETYRPHQSRSSPVLTTSVISSAGMTWRRPSTNFAPPVPPLRTQIILSTPSRGPLHLRKAIVVGCAAQFLREQAGLCDYARQKFWIHREALLQDESLGLGPETQLLEVRPGFFRVDVVRGQRRNSSPIVDACVDQLFIVWRGEIGRGLNIHVGE